jgi:hypothetical protein
MIVREIVMNKSLVLTAMLTVFLGACSSNPKNPEDVRASNYEALAKKEEVKMHRYIQDVAAKALEVQRVRKNVENALALPKMDADHIRQAQWQIAHVPPGMERLMEIEWKGAPEPLLRALAENSHYTIDFDKKPKPIEPTVVVHSFSQNIKQLIDEIERQSDGYIEDIHIYEDLKFIKVVYQEF